MEELVQMDGGGDVDILTAKLLAQWDWRDEEEEDRSFRNQHSLQIRCRSSSPESSSIYSTCSSPETQANAGDCPTSSDYPFNNPPGRRSSRSGDRHHQQQQKKPPKAKMSTKRRMKASEREKLRMRSLAEALHQLRDYLPPVYSRKGQPLTKIQTLKYTIEYIKELSDLLSQE